MVVLSTGESFKHSTPLNTKHFSEHPELPNVTSQIIKFLGAFTQLIIEEQIKLRVNSGVRDGAAAALPLDLKLLHPYT